MDSFERSKFITIHSTNTDPDWQGLNQQSLNAPNASADLIGDVMEGYDVYFGRDTGAMAWQLSQLNQDSDRPGFVSESHATTKGGDTRWIYNNSANYTSISRFENRLTDSIIAAQQHPYWPDGKTTTQGWAFSQADTPSEPFGTATGHYMGQFLAKYFNQGPEDTLGQPKPRLIEVMNEPLYDLVDAASTPVAVEKIFHFHNTVAAEIRKTNSDVLVGGYTTAFPDYDKNDFQQWLTRDKLFVDIAGENMDFYSIHLYDFPAHNNREKYRRGSNVEATLDLIEHYDTIKFGSIKPLIISEYGASIHTMFYDPWTPQRDGIRMVAINGLLMSFLERPNNILKTIPFIPLKAEWGRVNGVPYNDRLLRQRKEAPGDTGEEWVFTDLIKFYQLWSEVKGTRIDISSSDPDLVVNAYVNNQDLYVIVNNLDFSDVTFQLQDFSLHNPEFVNAKIKHFHRDSELTPLLTETALTDFPDTLTIGADGTMIIKIGYANHLVIDQTKNEQKIYATEYLKAISANNSIGFEISSLTTGDYGSATLRLGIGRPHGKSLRPQVTVNGQAIAVPEDYRGYDQYHAGKGRENFFGVIEIPVPYSILANSNQVEVTFPDEGGYISSAAIRVFHYSRATQHQL
ncbi:agarase [Cellvibrio sp. ARAG 10.3]|uniref:agarase n=1 Tax=Cellvibrio sp. ARAG 10.3 TaxID=3451358 RepID=UPI003F44C403